jgi:4-hydroxy-tetrahydrodipicolinate synthase
MIPDLEVAGIGILSPREDETRMKQANVLFDYPRRRDFLRLLGAGALGVTLSGSICSAQSRNGKTLRGIFPIAETPFMDSDKLDLDDLVKQLHFIDRGGVHGFVWPQLASEWSTLTERERLEGAAAIIAAGKKLRPAVVIGVQAPDAETAVKYAKHAAQAGADAIISLPPPNQKDPAAILEYYKTVGRATNLPLFVQAVGNMSVEFILQMWKAIPTLRFVKDEAGEPLMRIGPLREKSSDEIKVFTGGHGRTLIDEMSRGSSGSMPAASFADIYASVWDLWHAGKQKEAMDLFGKALLFVTEVQVYGIESLKYILHLRGIFKTYNVRRPKGSGAPSRKMLAAGGLERRSHLDEKGRQILKEMVEFARPYFKT